MRPIKRLADWALNWYVTWINFQITTFNENMQESRTQIRATLDELEQVIERRKGER